MGEKSWDSKEGRLFLPLTFWTFTRPRQYFFFVSMYSVHNNIEFMTMEKKLGPTHSTTQPKCDPNEINDHSDKEMGLPLDICCMHEEKMGRSVD